MSEAEGPFTVTEADRTQTERSFLTVEALDPLAALVTLAANVKHAGRERTPVTPRGLPGERLDTVISVSPWEPVHLLEVDFVHLELGLKDSRSQDTAAQQVLKHNQSQWVSPKSTEMLKKKIANLEQNS